MPEKMKAAVLYAPYDIRVEKVEKPKAESDDVVIRIRATGICPTDLRKYTGTSKIKEPLVLGHELSGEVHEVGENVVGIELGEKVTVNPFLFCYKCHYCRMGKFNMCLNLGAIGGAAELGKKYGGSFAQYLRIPAENVYKVSKETPFEEAALTEPLAACLNGILKCNIGLGDAVAIIGVGPIGLLHLQLARLVGAGKIIAIDLSESRRKKARELGADVTIDPKEEDAIKRVKELTYGRGAEAVIVATGGRAEATCTEEGLQMVARGGVVNIFAGTWPVTEVKFDPNIIHYGERMLLGSYIYTPTVFSRAAEIVSQRRLKLRKIVSHLIPLDDAKKALDTALGKAGLKVEILPWEL